MQIQEARPPYVEFKQVAVEDRNASIDKGMRITRNVNMAFIQQVGSKDQVEKVAEEWLNQLKKQCYEGIQPEPWFKHFNEKYKDFLAGRETPESGMPVREWPVLSPAEVENLIAHKVMTVEAVAELTEEALQRCGMGTRILRDKARNWLSAGNKGAEKLTALEVENKTLKEMLEKANERLTALEADKQKRNSKPG